MKIAPHLRRRPSSGPAEALLIRGTDVAGLLRLCSSRGIDPSGRVHAVEGGFLLRLPDRLAGPVPGALRLRAIVPNLYVPADADLVPALLEDEAEGLVGGRGIVFLPRGGAVAFDPRAPLELADLVACEMRPRRPWRPLPERPAIAEKLEELVLERPDDSPESLFESYGDDVGTEPPRPDDSKAASKVVGRATLGAGRGMIWLGGKLGLPSLTGLGAGLVGAAMRVAPRLSEAVLGRQAAALRSLLREFREGDTDRALRRALPLGEPGGSRGGVFETGDQLPTNQLAYSLDQLLDPGGRKRVSVWAGGHDVLAELGREYRKAAEQAIMRGDYRRAALIYGRLLRDYRAAANVLARGGLHRDAAILLLTRLDDPRGAARAFEAAGEADRAVQLYRRVGDHEAAGDLLRRIGEEDAALLEYRLAAERLVAISGGHLAAGRLLASKAGRADLALELYLAGWGRRPLANSLACAMEALTLFADAGAIREVLQLVGEVEAHLGATSTAADVPLFFNSLARLADRPPLAPIREELRDRSLMALAAQLRGQAGPGVAPGSLVSDCFVREAAWPVCLVRDADHAVKAAAKLAPPALRRPRSAGSPKRVFVASGLVTAVCSVPGTDEVFLGYEDGEVFCYRPERNEVHLVAAYDLPVTSLAAAADGSSLVVLRSGSNELGAVSSYSRSPGGSYRPMLGITIDGLTNPWLTPVLRVDAEDLVGLWDGHELYLMTVASLTSSGSMSLPRPDASPPTALLLPREDAGDPSFDVLVHDGREWCLAESSGRSRHATGLVWRPSLPRASPLKSVPISWDRGRPGHVELAGLGGYGTLHWAMLRSEDGRLDLVASNSAAREGGYRAAALVRSRVVAGVTGSHVEWLRCGSDRFTLASSTAVDLPSAVACFSSRRTAELIVVADDGSVSCIPHRS